jgi:hypothetical protein
MKFILPTLILTLLPPMADAQCVRIEARLSHEHGHQAGFSTGHPIGKLRDGSQCVLCCGHCAYLMVGDEKCCAEEFLVHWNGRLMTATPLAVRNDEHADIGLLSAKLDGAKPLRLRVTRAPDGVMVAVNGFPGQHPVKAVYATVNGNTLRTRRYGELTFGMSGGPVVMGDAIVGVFNSRESADYASGLMTTSDAITDFCLAKLGYVPEVE